MAENKYQYSYQYPHPAVTTDCVVFGYDVAPEDRESKKKNKRMALQVLLIGRGRGFGGAIQGVFGVEPRPTRARYHCGSLGAGEEV